MKRPPVVSRRKFDLRLRAASRRDEALHIKRAPPSPRPRAFLQPAASSRESPLQVSPVIQRHEGLGWVRAAINPGLVTLCSSRRPVTAAERQIR